MLNEPLYRAIAHVFKQTPKIVNEDVRASIDFPPSVVSMFNEVTTLEHTRVKGGEQYYVCCPYCRDSRYRLNFSYLWDTNITAGTNLYHCSSSLFNCFNEKCQETPAIRKEIVESLRAALADRNVLANVDLSPVEVEDESEQSLLNQVKLPNNLKSITDPTLPYYVAKYWLGERKFTVDDLERNGVRFTYLNYPVKLGAPVCRQMVTIIPVIQNGDYWFYQIRLIPLGGDSSNGYERDQLGDELPRYIIPKGSRKSWALYNIDKAEYQPTVYILEGPTDVWRVGDAGIARFGKTLSFAQINQIKVKLNGKNIVIVPDMDDAKALELAIKQREMLDKTGMFKSVRISKLPAGMDPGDITNPRKEAVCAFLDECIDLAGMTTASLFGGLAIK